MSKRHNRKRHEISPDRARQMLSYDEETGIFRWNKSGYGGREVGDIAGTNVTGGYISIGLDGKYYKAHRLAWFYMHGVWPDGVIDHVDGNPANNRVANLREASKSDNSLNFHTPRFNKTGFRGVSAYKGRFTSQPKFRGERFHLGIFDTADRGICSLLEIQSQ